MTRPPKTTTREKRDCAVRELAMRKAAYPAWVARGAMTAKDAARELRVMAAIASEYQERLEDEEGAPRLKMEGPDAR